MKGARGGGERGWWRWRWVEGEGGLIREGLSEEKVAKKSEKWWEKG